MYLQKYDLKGRTAVVTGGGRAIGLACVEALAEAGARVVIADYDAKVAAEGQAEMKSKGHAVDTVKMDVTNSQEVTKVADEHQPRARHQPYHGQALRLRDRRDVRRVRRVLFRDPSGLHQSRELHVH